MLQRTIVTLLRAIRVPFILLNILVLFSSTSLAYAAATQQGIDPALKSVLKDNINNFNPTLDTSCTTTPTAIDASKSTSVTLDQEIAQTFIVGFDSSDTATAQSVVNDNKIGGIFFLSGQGADTSKLTKAYFDTLNKSTANGKLFIAADDEGGKVALIGQRTPSAAAMGTMSVDAITTQAKITGTAMAGAGFTGDLAPVLDIQTPGTLWTQDQRDWSSDKNTIISKAGAFAAGLQASGITPVYKHFPGIGKVGANGVAANNTDTGATAPQNLKDMADDLAPYQALLGKNGGAVMLDNGYISEWGSQPVSLNANAVTYLRKTLKFTGVITTDALNAFANYSTPIDTPTAVTDALAAGVDMPLFVVKSADTDSTIKSAIANVKAAITSGKISQATIDAAYKNSLALRGITSPSSVVVPVSNTVSNTSLNCCVTATNGQVVGVDTASGNVAAVMNYFIAKGFTPQAAASVIGNWQVESGDANLQPNTQESGADNFPNGGWGVAQWSFGRRTLLVAALQKAGLGDFYSQAQSDKPLAPADNQKLLTFELDYAWGEITTDYSSLLTSMAKSTDIISATDTFERIYEGCSPTNGRVACDVAGRETKATNAYNAFVAGGGAATAPVDVSLTPGTPAVTNAADTSATCSDSTGGSSGGTLTGDGTILKLPDGGVGQQVYYYNQADPEWMKTGNGYNYQECACGQTSTAMIESTLKNDTKITPVTIYNEVGDSGSQGAGKFQPGSCSGSVIGILLDAMKTDGLQTSAVQTRGNGGLDPAKVFAELKKGHIMIVHTSKWVGYVNKHATSGHYLVVYGADATGQNFYVANPGSRQDNNVPIPASGLSEWLDEAYAVWGASTTPAPTNATVGKPV